MMMPYTENIKEEVMSFAQLFLADQAFVALEKSIPSPLSLADLPIELSINNDNDAEFYLKPHSVGHQHVVEIKHYQN